MRIVGYRGGGKRSATDGSVLLLEKTYAVQCEEMLNIFLGHFWEEGGEWGGFSRPVFVTNPLLPAATKHSTFPHSSIACYFLPSRTIQTRLIVLTIQVASSVAS